MFASKGVDPLSDIDVSSTLNLFFGMNVLDSEKHTFTLSGGKEENTLEGVHGWPVTDLDAINDELIPYIDTVFNTIPKPYARIQEGGSTGGWISVASVIFRPDLFGASLSRFSGLPQAPRYYMVTEELLPFKTDLVTIEGESFRVGAHSMKQGTSTSTATLLFLSRKMAVSTGNGLP